jgi:hypothetical protein
MNWKKERMKWILILLSENCIKMVVTFWTGEPTADINITAVYKMKLLLLIWWTTISGAADAVRNRFNKKIPFDRVKWTGDLNETKYKLLI